MTLPLRRLPASRTAAVGAKWALSRLGAVLPSSMLHWAGRSLDVLQTGRWMRDRGYETSHRVSSRYALFDLAAERLGESKILYLEFGVAAGDATRYWSQVLRGRDARLHGFDTFEGLPMDWTRKKPKGLFDQAGQLPLVEDDRVEFFKGLFSDTLPGYAAPEHDRLIVCLDADLYSSTGYVLNWLSERALIRPGAMLYFDEFNYPAHELRAFEELCDTTGMRFRLIAATYDLAGALFERTDRDPDGLPSTARPPSM
jgi:Macrocin-O-methyltransferase (TylF)